MFKQTTAPKRQIRSVIRNPAAASRTAGKSTLRNQKPIKEVAPVVEEVKTEEPEVPKSRTQLAIERCDRIVEASLKRMVETAKQQELFQ